MRTLIAMMAVLTLVPSSLAEDGAGGAAAQYEELSGEMEAARAAHSAAMKKVSSTAAYKETLAAFRAVKDPNERAPLGAKLREMRKDVPMVDWNDFRRRFRAGADEYAGSEGAVPFLVWLAVSGGKETAGSAVKDLSASHLGSPKLGDFLARLPYLTRSGLTVEEIRDVAAGVIEKNEVAELKAAAYYARARTWLAPGRNPEPLPEFAEQYAKDIAKVSEVAPGTLIALRAEGPTFERTRLQVGMKAPDIAARDLDSVAFKLSDYLGKVVVIDFWGDW